MEAIDAQYLFLRFRSFRCPELVEATKRSMLLMRKLQLQDQSYPILIISRNILVFQTLREKSEWEVSLLNLLAKQGLCSLRSRPLYGRQRVHGMVATLIGTAEDVELVLRIFINTKIYLKALYKIEYNAWYKKEKERIYGFYGTQYFKRFVNKQWSVFERGNVVQSKFKWVSAYLENFCKVLQDAWLEESFKNYDDRRRYNDIRHLHDKKIKRYIECFLIGRGLD